MKKLSYPENFTIDEVLIHYNEFGTIFQYKNKEIYFEKEN